MPPSKVNLSYVIGLKPKDAIKYFESKGYKITWDWRDMLNEAHNQAFTVARVTQMDVLMDIRNEVRLAIKDGLTLNKFREELEPTLKKHGWWGKGLVEGEEVLLGSPWRLNTIFRTNMMSSYNAGRWKAFQENKELRPYLQYISLNDDIARPEHKKLHEKVFHADDPFWNTHYPPNGYRCRCRVRALTADQVESKGLTVEQGTGKMEAKADPETGIQQTFYKDPSTGELISPDLGFSNNPGQALWTPNLSDYDSDILTQSGLA